MFSTIKNFLNHACTQSWSLGVLIGLIVFLYIPQTQHLITRIRNDSYDFYQRIKPREYRQSPVKIISIDNKTLEKIGQFPWSRLKTAELIDKLHRLGARVIVFDMLFSEPDRTSPNQLKKIFFKYPQLVKELNKIPDNDEVLAQSIKKANVVTSFMLRIDAVTKRLPAIKAGMIIKGAVSFSNSNCFFPNAMTTMELFEKQATGNGSLAYIADEDGVIRNVPLFLCFQDKLSANEHRLYPSIGLEAVRLYQQQKNYFVHTNEDNEINRIDIGNDIQLYPNSKGNIWLHYTKKLDSRYIPAWQVFEQQVLEKEIKDKIVFIGVTAISLFDMRFNPFGRVIPGVEVHAQLAEQLLENSYLQKTDYETALVIIFFIFISFFICKTYQKYNGIVLSCCLLTVIALILALCWWSFVSFQLLIDPIIPSFGCIFLFIAFFIQKQLKTEREKRWLREAFGRYISPNRVKYLIEHPESLTLGGHYRECTFVMTDLAGFTSLMEKHSPHECVTMLNQYLDGMINIAFKYHGTLDRIVGDAVAVIFSAPIVQKNHQRLALQCALEMDAYALEFVQNKSKQGIQFGITRIGVCTGKVLIGNFGGKTMFDYRALGDPINTASRLESVNKQFKTRLCVAESTLSACPDFKARPIGDLVLKGKTEKIKAFELLTETEFKKPVIQDYLIAYQQLEMQSENIRSIFEKLIAKYPTDCLIQYHYRRLKNQQTGATIILKDK